MDQFLINGSIAQSIFVYGLGALILYFVIAKWARIRTFSGEVKTELQKATWPWDPKEKSFGAKYKELIDSTLVVVIAMLLLSAFVAIGDFALMGLSRVVFK